MRASVLATLAVAILVGCGGSTADEIPTDQQDTSVDPGDTSVGEETTPSETGGEDTTVTPTDGDVDTSTPTPDADPDAPCLAPKATCGGACVDLASDTNNCGVCGTRCLPGQTCITAGGATACACATGKRICGMGTGAVCTDTTTDVNNCGGCGTRCTSGETCEAGACKCKTGITTMCGTRCVDTQTDPNNCGTCGTNCPAYGTCVAGGCKCPTGAETTCTTGFGRQCTDTTEDPNHCGTCGNDCNNSEMCDGTGKCVCRTGLTSCTFGGDSFCVDTKTNPRACGACGTTCTGSQVCEGGTCKTATTCSTGLTRCGSGGGGGSTTLYGCTDTSKDTNNCGGCGRQCDQDQVCVAGNCRDYRPAFGCTTCPCAGCAVTSACCTKLATGATAPICVAGGACP
jgi:hypothetical protein